MNISIAWLATSLSELELLSLLLAVTIKSASLTSITSSSSVGNFSPHHRTFSHHLHFPHPMPFFIVSPNPHQPPFCLIFSSIFMTNFGAQLYSILSPYRYKKIAIISNISLMGGMKVVIPSCHRRSSGTIPPSSQHMTQYFHSFTTSSASIFSSTLST